jgi:flagellar hook-basal body complex protein FliE
MSQMAINQVLAQIRALSAQTQAKPAAGAASNRPAAATLRSCCATASQKSIRANSARARLPTAFERGTPGVELPQVMLEMQKASVSFRALTEVRNRLVTAYQDIMNMPM